LLGSVDVFIVQFSSGVLVFLTGRVKCRLEKIKEKVKPRSIGAISKRSFTQKNKRQEEEQPLIASYPSRD
jgi:hypothetical protein